MKYERCRPAECRRGWALIREALQAAPADLPELYYTAECGWVVAW